MTTKEEYTNSELDGLEIISDGLIIELFNTKDKRYAISKALKSAFQLGSQKK
jgi:predicted RNA-binding protein associated with RNAse of E/G family